MSLQETMALLASIRSLGIEIRADDAREHILWRPRQMLPQELYRKLAGHRAEALALLCAHDREVVWRVHALRMQIPPKGSIPPLQARPYLFQGARYKRCGSCGDPLTTVQQYVCLPCQHALWLALEGAGDLGGGKAATND